MAEAQRGARRRTRLIGLLIAVIGFTAIMLTLILTAIFPALMRLAAPLLCSDTTVRSAVVSTSHGTSDGATVVESALYCVDAQGWAVEANGVAAYGVLAGMSFLLLAGVLGLLVVQRGARGRRTAAVVAAGLLLGGCSWGTTDANAFDEQTSLVGPLYLSGAAEEVAADYAAAVGGTVRVRSFVLYPGHALIEAQDPQRPDRFDRYLYQRGKVQRPEPLDVSNDQIEGTVFALDELALDQIPRMVRTAVATGRVEGGDVTHIVARRDPGEPVELTAYVDGLRGSATVDFDAAGNPLAP